MIELVIENPSSGNIHYRSRRCEVDIRPHSVGSKAQKVIIPTDCLEGLIMKLKEYPWVSIQAVSQEEPVAQVQEVAPEIELETVGELTTEDSGKPSLDEFMREATAKKEENGVYLVTYKDLSFEIETDHHKKAKSAAYNHFFGGDNE